ncbi:MAG: tetratricopeptide (TPR) repeat protein [Polyangiales bacterium]|jgi:tetratricopeptide (TPR) repeat protein
MGYWIYYVLMGVAWYALEHPIIIVPVVAFFVFRRFIPDPWVLTRTFARSRRLRDQIRANPANVTARRDLAMVYLERLRPKKAMETLAPAIERDPENAEIRYLLGLAQLRSGEFELALASLVYAAGIDPRVRFGDSYRAAGDALMRLKRHEDAVDAYERFVELNTSSVEGWTKLSRANREHGAKEASDKALREAKKTWSVLPGYKRRQEWRWYLRCQLGI